MTRKKQPVDVEVLSKIMAVKDLERTLRDDNSFYQESKKVISRRPELTDAEEERFATGYVAFVDDYTNEVISGRLQAVYDEHKEALDGTPEGKYLQTLIEDSGRSMVRGDEVYDTKIKDLPLPTRLRNCLKNDNIEYIGQLVQKTEAEMLTTPNFGRKGLSELKEILKKGIFKKHGLEFGMDIDYTPINERK